MRTALHRRRIRRLNIATDKRMGIQRLRHNEGPTTLTVVPCTLLAMVSGFCVMGGLTILDFELVAFGAVAGGLSNILSRMS